jgi:hypothetical protein
MAKRVLLTEERLWTAAQLVSAATIRFLRARNCQGCDVYIHPYAGNQNAGYVLVDLDRADPTAVDLKRERIFDLFYRGRSARDQEEEGAGFGLYLAQFIAMTIGTRIYASQSSDQNRLGYWTTFSVRFRRDR